MTNEEVDKKVAEIIDAGFCVAETFQMLKNFSKKVGGLHHHWPLEPFINWVERPGVGEEVQCLITQEIENDRPLS